MDVDIVEPDVSPLAVQGPKADELMSRVFGDEVRDIRFFRYKRMAFMDTEFGQSRLDRRIFARHVRAKG